MEKVSGLLRRGEGRENCHATGMPSRDDFAVWLRLVPPAATWPLKREAVQDVRHQLAGGSPRWVLRNLVLRAEEAGFPLPRDLAALDRQAVHRWLELLVEAIDGRTPEPEPEPESPSVDDAATGAASAALAALTPETRDAVEAFVAMFGDQGPIDGPRAAWIERWETHTKLRFPRDLVQTPEASSPRDQESAAPAAAEQPAATAAEQPVVPVERPAPDHLVDAVERAILRMLQEHGIADQLRAIVAEFHAAGEELHAVADRARVRDCMGSVTSVHDLLVQIEEELAKIEPTGAQVGKVARARTKVQSARDLLRGAADRWNAPS